MLKYILFFSIYCLSNYYITNIAYNSIYYAVTDNDYIVPKIYDVYYSNYSCSRNNINGNCPYNFKCNYINTFDEKHNYTYKEYKCIDPDLINTNIEYCKNISINQLFQLELIIVMQVLIKLCIIFIVILITLFKKFLECINKNNSEYNILYTIDYKLLSISPLILSAICSVFYSCIYYFSRSNLDCFIINEIKILDIYNILIYNILEILLIVLLFYMYVNKKEHKTYKVL